MTLSLSWTLVIIHLCPEKMIDMPSARRVVNGSVPRSLPSAMILYSSGVWKTA